MKIKDSPPAPGDTGDGGKAGKDEWKGWQIDKALSGLLYSSWMFPRGRRLGGGWWPVTYEEGIKGGVKAPPRDSPLSRQQARRRRLWVSTVRSQDPTVVSGGVFIRLSRGSLAEVRGHAGDAGLICILAVSLSGFAFGRPTHLSHTSEGDEDHTRAGRTLCFPNEACALRLLALARLPFETAATRRSGAPIPDPWL